MRVSSGFLLLCLLSVGLSAGWNAPLPSARATWEGRRADCGPEGQPIPIPEDTLLHIDNRGVERIFATISGQAFKLVTDPGEVARSANAFLIPQRGAISINIAALIDPEGANCYAFSLQGAADTGAQFFIANTPLAGQPIAYAIGGLEPIPEAFDLAQNYPNPFRHGTTITYEIPARRTNGLPVEIALYDVLGRHVRTLVDDRRFPGEFTARWDGTDDYGAPVPAGLYLCRITAGRMQQTIKLVRLK